MEIEIEDESFIGMPFVLISDGKWIKNKGSDFYVELVGGAEQAQEVLMVSKFFSQFDGVFSIHLFYFLVVFLRCCADIGAFPLYFSS